MTTKIECPKCQGLLRVWIEIDAELSFQVSRTGHLSKREIEDSGQTDGRAGVRCPNCGWEVHNHDLEDDDIEGMSEAIEAAYEGYYKLRLSVVKAKD